MTYKLNIDRNIEPTLNALQKWSASPVGWWNVTTEGDVEGRSIINLGTHYGHIAAIALCTKCSGYALRFAKADPDISVHGATDAPAKTQKIITKSVNISIDVWSHKGGQDALAEWLDCDEIQVKPCNFYGAYTIVLMD